MVVLSASDAALQVIRIQMHTSADVCVVGLCVCMCVFVYMCVRLCVCTRCSVSHHFLFPPRRTPEEVAKGSEEDVHDADDGHEPGEPNALRYGASGGWTFISKRKVSELIEE